MLGIVARVTAIKIHACLNLCGVPELKKTLRKLPEYRSKITKSVLKNRM
jgi:hypothetical protein